MPVTEEDLQKFDAIIETIWATDSSEMVMKIYQYGSKTRTILRVHVPEESPPSELEDTVVCAYLQVVDHLGFIDEASVEDGGTGGVVRPRAKNGIAF